MDHSLILQFWEASPERFPGATRSELVRDFHNLFGRGSVLDVADFQFRIFYQ